MFLALLRRLPCSKNHQMLIGDERGRGLRHGWQQQPRGGFLDARRPDHRIHQRRRRSRHSERRCVWSLTVGLWIRMAIKNVEAHEAVASSSAWSSSRKEARVTATNSAPTHPTTELQKVRAAWAALAARHRRKPRRDMTFSSGGGSKMRVNRRSGPGCIPLCVRWHAQSERRLRRLIMR